MPIIQSQNDAVGKIEAGKINAIHSAKNIAHIFPSSRTTRCFRGFARGFREFRGFHGPKILEVL